MEQKARQMTVTEVRETFLRHIWHLIDYWEKENRAQTSLEKMEGLAHSILTTLDGYNGALPGFTVCPKPHPDDKEYDQEQGENWYPPGVESDTDIAGQLRKKFYEVKFYEVAEKEKSQARSV